MKSLYAFSFAFAVVLCAIFVYVRLKPIHIIHRIDKNNTGDMVSTCTNYFYFPKITKHDIYKVDMKRIMRDDFVIFSGGGLFNNNDSWNDTINNVLQLTPNCYGWGVGINLHTKSKISRPIEYGSFKKLGIRDYANTYGIPYLPCSSCMIPDLKQSYIPVRKYGILEHIHHKVSLDLPKMKNNKPIEEIIRFIGETEYVVTNTYHCYYFCMLMKKRVVLYKKFSSKFDGLRYPPVMYSGDLEKDFGRCKVYPEFHKECIELNKRFYLGFMRDYITYQ